MIGGKSVKKKKKRRTFEEFRVWLYQMPDWLYSIVNENKKYIFLKPDKVVLWMLMYDRKSF